MQTLFIARRGILRTAVGCPSALRTGQSPRLQKRLPPDLRTPPCHLTEAEPDVRRQPCFICPLYSTLLKSSFPTPQSGHTQSSGISSHAVPGSIPLSGSPTSGSYSYPQTSQTYLSIIYLLTVTRISACRAAACAGRLFISRKPPLPEQKAALRLFARWCAQASACTFRCAPVASSRSVFV